MPAVRVFNSKIPRFAWPRLHIHLEEESQGVSALNSHSHKYLWLIGPAVPPFSVPDVARYWATDRLRVYFFSIFLARYVDQEIVLVAPGNVWNDVFRPHCTCMWARLCARLAVTRFFFVIVYFYSVESDPENKIVGIRFLNQETGEGFRVGIGGCADND